MSIKINKNGKEYDLGFVPQSLYDDVEDLKDAVDEKVSDNPTFTEAQTRANIASGESFATILGKIKKFFTDLKAVAFSGDATDVAYNSNTTVKQKIDAVESKIDNKIKTESQTTTTSAYGYFGWIAPANVNVIFAHSDSRFLVLAKWSDGWYVAQMNSTGTGFVGNATFDVTYTYYN